MSVLWALSEIRNPIFDAFFNFITFFGEEILIFAVICLLYWCIDKPLTYKIALAFFLSGLLVQVLKVVLRIERPWVIDPSFLPERTHPGGRGGVFYRGYPRKEKMDKDCKRDHGSASRIFQTLSRRAYTHRCRGIAPFGAPFVSCGISF